MLATIRDIYTVSLPTALLRGWMDRWILGLEVKGHYLLTPVCERSPVRIIREQSLLFLFVFVL